MAAVSARDPRAERQVVERLAGRVRRVTGLLRRSPADAEDAAQLALLEILSSAGSFRVALSLEHWADRIATRVALRQRRRERGHQSLLSRWLNPGTLPWGAEGQTPAGERPGLEAFLGELSEERREAFVLRHALDHTVEEIAVLTGAPIGTVKDRLVAARKQLRRKLEHDARRVDLRGMS